MIDLHELKRQTAGDAALQDELLALFQVQMEELAATLDEPHDGEPTRRADLPLLLHRIRGAAAAIGARDLAASLAQTEAALTLDPGSSRDLEQLRTELATARTTLAGLIATRPPAALAKASESR